MMAVGRLILFSLKLNPCSALFLESGGVDQFVAGGGGVGFGGVRLSRLEGHQLKQMQQPLIHLKQGKISLLV